MTIKKKKNGIILVLSLFLMMIATGSLIVFINLKEPILTSETVKQNKETVSNATVNENIDNTYDNSDTVSVDTTTTVASDNEYVEGVITDNVNSVFIGQIGTQNVLMSIYRNSEQLTASCITQNDDNREITLHGTIQTNIASFNLYSEDNEIIFKGTIIPNTEKGELIEGTYTSPENLTGVPFSLALSYSIDPSIKTRYSDVTSSSTTEVEQFAKKIKKYIIEDNKSDLANLIDYPINVTINDVKVRIHSAKEFEQNYNNIITPDFKERVSKAYTRYLNSNYMGIMLGNGEIWFGDVIGKEGLHIFAINN